MLTLDPEILSGLLKACGAGIVGLGAYLWKQLDGRVEKLEENNVSRKEFDELRGDVRGLYGKIDENKDELIAALLKDRG